MESKNLQELTPEELKNVEGGSFLLGLAIFLIGGIIGYAWNSSNM